MRNLKEYRVELKNGVTVFVKSKNVKVTKDNVLIFFNTRDSIGEQYVYGSEIVATFNSNEYSYFIEEKPDFII